MTQKVLLDVPLNRVEGDLEVRVEIQDHTVVDAWSAGTLYRGIESLLTGRGALDGLVITPRVCGICTTGHLTAACAALDNIAGTKVPDHAIRVKNLALMVENLQSDLRHAFLMFMPDFTNTYYYHSTMYEEAVARYQPLQGSTVREVLQETRSVLEIISILGGQWPHSSFMVPGGITSTPNASEVLHCNYLLKRYRDWYEQRILGCNLERWNEVSSETELEQWLQEADSHREGELGFFIRFAHAANLHRLGKGPGNFLSYGAYELPGETSVIAHGNRLVPSGFAAGEDVQDFDHEQIAEHVFHSWYMDYEGGRHPWEGETKPYASGSEGRKYSWAKAPRYQGLPAETGPLAEAIIRKDPLFKDLTRNGATVFARELARLVRPAQILPAMQIWLKELLQNHDSYYESPGDIVDGAGFGLTDVTRGALGHWVKIERGKIAKYQIITPTAWNASPRDSSGVRGPWEQALIGAEIRDPANPVEVGHIVRSFDACLVCTVHALHRGKQIGRVRV